MLPVSEPTDISSIYEAALGTGARPFGYQQRIAEHGLPELLDAPTGSGKTPAIMLAWLFRILLHPDQAIRQATPTRLIWCMPLRSLTVQTADLARRWVAQLGLQDEVDVHVLMGGESFDDQQFRMQPHKPAIILSTIDMALSRALNRGYRSTRFTWPIDFALFNSDCHWVFDEVQLMGVSLTTSRQLHGLRQSLGTAKPHGSTWMSATIPNELLLTVDASAVGETVSPTPEDRSNEVLKLRLEAPKTLVCSEVPDRAKFPQGIAATAWKEHRPGTLTLLCVNTVDIAQAAAKELTKLSKGSDTAPNVVILHSRFRPADREAALAEVLDRSGPSGTIAVCTQVIEAGIDVSATTMVTECAPWSSIVQRAGRCNRDGLADDARLVIVRNTKPGPYEPDDLELAWNAALGLDRSTVTPESLADIQVASSAQPMLTLRRADLLDLFDTAADLSGNDIDVSRFIHEDTNLDIAIAWRNLDPYEPNQDELAPSPTEMCPVAIGAARDFLRSNGPALIQDPLLANRDRRFNEAQSWRIANADDLRPGVLLVFPTTAGGYTSITGFNRTSRAEVEELRPPSLDEQNLEAANSVASDRSTTEFEKQTLRDHLIDVEAAASELCRLIGVRDPDIVETVKLAGRLHDLGKAHPAFQGAIRSATGDAETAGSEVLAKSGTRKPLRYDDRTRKGFRHEFASALVLLDQPHLIGEALDADLVTYLVAAHHGIVRLGIRSLPHEPDGQVLGVRDGDTIDEVDLGPTLRSEPAVLSLSIAQLGFSEAGESWTSRALRLLESHGPFKLAWLEMLVRIADWRASQAADRQVGTASEAPR